MATRKTSSKSRTKSTAKKGASSKKTGGSSNPKFGSPAWFAKYPKAARVAKKSTKKKK